MSEVVLAAEQSPPVSTHSVFGVAAESARDVVRAGVDGSDGDMESGLCDR